MFYLPGLIYSWPIDFLLKGIKNTVARFIFQLQLYPALDICSGTGKQCHLIGMHNQKIIGLDRDLKMIQYASSKYPHLPFICADAAEIPLKKTCFKGIIISYSLHDKSPELRKKILAEAKRLLASDGKLILVDFEQPWNKLSHLARFFTYLIERMASREHFKNGRQFLKQGGLEPFIKQNGLVEIERLNIPLGCSSIVVARFA